MGDARHTDATASRRSPAKEPEQLLNADEVGALLDLAPVTVLRKARQRRIGCVRDGKSVKFRAEHVAAYIAAHEQPAAPAQVPARPKR